MEQSAPATLNTSARQPRPAACPGVGRAPEVTSKRLDPGLPFLQCVQGGWPRFQIRRVARQIPGATKILLGLIGIYQKISALGIRRCRFYPTCSEYMRESLQVLGFWSGLSQGILRLLRCHPWNPGGVDLVRMPNGK